MLVSAESDPAKHAAFMIPLGALESLDSALSIVGLSSQGITAGITRNLAALEAFLGEYVGGSDRAVPFGGRSRELEQLDAWLADGSSPFGLLVAEAGRGKSALLAQWAVELDRRAVKVAFLPISMRFNTADRPTAMGLLGERLRYLADVSADLPSDPAEWAFEIESLLREDDSKPLLLIIDGADETVGWNLSQHLKVPRDLGEGRRILISARIVGDRDLSGWGQSFNWPSYRSFDLPGLNARGVYEALGQLGIDPGDRVGEEIIRLSEGDPLLVRLYADALQDGSLPSLERSDLPDVSPGLRGFFERWWSEQHQIWAEQGRDPIAEQRGVDALMACLTVALGPLSRDDLSAIGVEAMPTGLALSRAADDVGRLVIGDGTDHGYVLSHPRLREYFREELDRATVDRIRRGFIAYGAAAVEAIAAGGDPEQWSYAVRHYSAHLVESEGSAGSFFSLLSGSWMNAWADLDNSLDGYRDDVDRGWEKAIEVGSLPMQLRAALFMSSLTSSGSPLPLSVLSGLVESKLWTSRQTLGYIRGLSRAVDRAHGIAAIADCLSDAEAISVTDLIEELGVKERVDFVISLAGRLSSATAGELAADTLAMAEVDDPQIVAYARGILHDLLAIEKPEEEKLAGLREIVDQRMKARVVETAYASGRVTADEALPWARTVTSLPSRARLLGIIAASVVDEDLTREALIAASAIKDPAERAETLSFLADHEFEIPEEQIREVQATACPDKAQDARRLISLVPLLSGEERERGLEAAISTVKSLRDPGRLGDSLARLAELIPAKRDELLLEALGVSRLIGDPGEQVVTVAALLCEQPEPDPSSVVETLRGLDRRSQLQPADGPVYFARLLAHLQERSDEAISICLNSLYRSNPEARAQGLVHLVPLLGAKMACQAWKILLDDPPSRDRTIALGELAEGYGPILLGHLSRQTALPARTEALVVLISRLPDSSFERVEHEIQRLTQESDAALCRMMLAVYDRREGGPFPARVITYWKRILDPAIRRDALLKAITALPPEERGLAVSVLVDDLRRSASDYGKHTAIVELASIGLRGTDERLLALAAEIEDPALRISALAYAGATAEAKKGLGTLSAAPVRARVLAKIAKDTMDSSLAAEAIDALTGLDDSIAGPVIARTADLIEAEHLPVAIVRAVRIGEGHGRRLALSSLARRFDELTDAANVALWPHVLRILSCRPRPEALGDLRAIAPALSYDGEDVYRSLIETIKEIGRELP
jgi:hypothetical protein